MGSLLKRCCLLFFHLSSGWSDCPDFIYSVDEDRRVTRQRG
jgi:hypothetical protein